MTERLAELVVFGLGVVLFLQVALFPIATFSLLRNSHLHRTDKRVVIMRLLGVFCAVGLFFRLMNP